MQLKPKTKANSASFVFVNSSRGTNKNHFLVSTNAGLKLSFSCRIIGDAQS